MRQKKIYKIEADVDQYAWIDPFFEEDQYWLTNSRGLQLPPAERLPFQVTDLREKNESRLNLGDFPQLFPPLLCFSAAAWSCVGGLVSKSGSNFQIEHDRPTGEALIGFLLETKIDCIDENSSDVIRFRTSGNIMKINRYVLKMDGVCEVADIFRPDGVVNDVFVTGRFFEAWVSAGLVGAKFKEIEVRP